MTKKILIINGPNLNLLGEREESKYGNITLEEVKKNCESHAKSIGVELIKEDIIDFDSLFNTCVGSVMVILCRRFHGEFPLYRMSLKSKWFHCQKR